MLTGLYVITPDDFVPETLDVFDQSPGWCALQYRDKGATPEQARVRARALLKFTRKWGMPLIINDHIWLCLELGAEGLHVGEHDGDIGSVRKQLGKNIIVGSSCYNAQSRALAAMEAEVSYISFGAFFPTPTKPHAPRATHDLLSWAKDISGNCSVFAIGGIEPQHTRKLLGAGADGICVVRGILGASDYVASSEAYLKELVEYTSK
ncbi:MAG: thiamine phosphate synthase [Methylacidiphilales bacterium]|nr:thiamine phosphate synthase [Candidatus Methylacidiphilales bacterium]